MTHWRSLGDANEFLAAYDLPTDRTATIKRVRGVELPGTAEIKASKRPVIEFEKTAKKLIVNATNGKTIAAMYGPNVEEWKGKRITLYATTTKAKGGGIVECVRVRPTIPKASAGPIESQPVDEAMRERQMRGAGEPAAPASDDAPPAAASRTREPGEEG
jgi:hypothetical protein